MKAKRERSKEVETEGNKKTKIERNEKDTLGKLPIALGTKILKEFTPNLPDMSLKRMAEFSRVSKTYHTLFQPLLDDAKAAYPLLLNVVQGNLKALKKQVLANHERFFLKGQVTDPSGQTFYNVSPYQLMIFLCDDDMKRQILPLIPKTLCFRIGNRQVELDTGVKRRNQYAEIDSGGADLVKIDRDPTQLEFDEIIRFKKKYTVNGILTAVNFSLLENPDGIICYKNPTTKEMKLYYANQITQTVEPLKFKISSREEEQLYDSFTGMANNSSRRSSNMEHELIARVTKYQLSRKGIQYEYRGQLYCDSRIEFRLLNAYRKIIRLYHEHQWYAANAYLCSGVGDAQRQVLWVLQRICEPGRPFNPIPDFNSSTFRRNFTIGIHGLDNESVCSSGRLANGLGSNYALYKGNFNVALARHPSNNLYIFYDMLAINQLIYNAKANITEFTANKELIADDAGNLCHSPGR